VGILACAWGYFRCRHCHRLKYGSQLETDLDRANRKVQKLKARLGGKTWLKPKRMHQKTFDRLTHRLIEAEMKADEFFCLAAARIMARSPFFRESFLK
jgi:CCR4-NOT transcriptional regulation complex NOT5 subunit